MDITYNQKFSLADPYGHYSRDTKIERLWNSFHGAFSIERTKISQYSQYAGMSYIASKFDLTPFNIIKDFPQEEWIIENLKTFVRTEFAEHEMKTNPPVPISWPPKIEKEIDFSFQEFDRFILQSEWSNRKIHIEQPQDDSPQEIAKSIYDFLCHPLIGSPKNRLNNDKNEFIQNLLPTIKEKKRLLFVLPAFPFKDQNRFRVDYNADTPDFGEISFMLRLSNITETIYQVYPQGSDIVVLTDGDLYKDIFNISTQDVAKYLCRLKEYRYNMNIQGAISFISLKEMVDRSGDDSFAWKIKNYIQKQLKEIIYKSNNPEIKGIFSVLVSGMKWNLDNRTSLSEYKADVCWKILRWERDDIESQYQQIWDYTHQRAISAALEYASVNLMLRWTKLISLFFPDAIRATIHPKKNQFSLSAGGAYAWNGVAFSKNFPKSIDDIKVTPLLSISDNTPLYKVNFNATNLPCFYTTMPKNINIELAKGILNSEGWVYENIHGREFKLSDVDEFIKLGDDDISFSWERKLQSSTYYTSLLQFRISHYKKYGFGVHGIWVDGKLIGQFGIQVLDEDLDRVEVVIFLGKNYTKQGIGQKLLKHIVSLCQEKGLNEIYGVMRPENVAAIKLLKNNKWEKIGAVKHYNHEGILCKLKLKKN